MQFNRNMFGIKNFECIHFIFNIPPYLKHQQISYNNPLEHVVRVRYKYEYLRKVTTCTMSLYTH